MSILNILNSIENNIQLDYNNEVDKISLDFEKLCFIKENFTQKEVLQLFMCIYVVNVTILELNEWNVHQLNAYLKETDEFYNKYYKLYYKELIKYILNT